MNSVTGPPDASFFLLTEKNNKVKREGKMKYGLTRPMIFVFFLTAISLYGYRKTNNNDMRRYSIHIHIVTNSASYRR